MIRLLIQQPFSISYRTLNGDVLLTIATKSLVLT